MPPLSDVVPHCARANLAIYSVLCRIRNAISHDLGPLIIPAFLNHCPLSIEFFVLRIFQRLRGASLVLITAIVRVPRTTIFTVGRGRSAPL